MEEEKEKEERIVTPVKTGRVPVVMEEEKEKEERIVTPVKTTRGKKVLQDVSVENEQVPSDQKPRRGRGKKAQEEIAVVEEEKVKKSEESSSQRRRGARKVVGVEEVQEAAEPVAPVEDPASPVLKTSAQPKRGAKKGKGKVVERVAASEIPLPSSEPCGTCKKTKRGITWDNEVEGGDSEEETPVPVEAVQLGHSPEVKGPSTKKGGRRKLALVEE